MGLRSHTNLPRLVNMAWRSSKDQTWVRDKKFIDVVNDSIGSKLVSLCDDGFAVDGNLITITADLQHGALQGLQRCPGHNGLRAVQVLQNVVIQQI